MSQNAVVNQLRHRWIPTLVYLLVRYKANSWQISIRAGFSCQHRGKAIFRSTHFFHVRCDVVSSTMELRNIPSTMHKQACTNACTPWRAPKPQPMKTVVFSPHLPPANCRTSNRCAALPCTTQHSPHCETQGKNVGVLPKFSSFKESLSILEDYSSGKSCTDYNSWISVHF